MQLWTFHRYRAPQLCVDAIDCDADEAVVQLHQAGARYRLQFDHANSASDASARLESLRDSGSSHWAALRDAGDQGWGAIGEFLDSRALIGEGWIGAEEELDQRLKSIEQCIAATAAAALDGLSSEQRARLAAHVEQLQAPLEAALAGTAQDTGHAFDASRQPNFHLGLIEAELAYFQRSSPLALRATAALFALLRDQRRALRSDDALREALALYAPHDLESHLWLIAQSLVASTAPAAARMPTPELPDLPLLSGLEFMRQIEILTRSTLRVWGDNGYVQALDALGDRYAPLIAGPFIEQYHVTSRFVEIIAPTLSQRLIAPLRRLAFQYYSEEVGHEALESTTCETLGVTQAALDKAIPLPLHFAFVDLLTLVAQTDPIASFASIMVIEGVFGEPPRMSLRLAAIARTNPAFSALAGDHDELNEDLNHNSISRDAFEHIAGVPRSTQRRVLHAILFLLELNHRAWDGIASFYGPQDTLWLQGPLGLRLSPAGTLEG